MEIFKRFFRESYYSFKGMFLFLSPITYLTVLIISPIFSMFFFVLIARDAYGSSIDITQYVIGNALILCYVSAFYNVGNIINEERNFGTLKLFVSADRNKFSLLISKGFFFIINGLTTVVLGLIIGSLIFGIKIPGSLEFAVCMIVAVYSVSGMGFFVGIIGMLTRDSNLILNIWNLAFMALCGINYSTESLPFVLQKISNVLPLKHSMDAIIFLLKGNGNVSHSILSELIIGTVFYLIAVIALTFFEKISIRYGVLDYF